MKPSSQRRITIGDRIKLDGSERVVMRIEGNTVTTRSLEGNFDVWHLVDLLREVGDSVVSGRWVPRRDLDRSNPAMTTLEEHVRECIDGSNPDGTPPRPQYDHGVTSQAQRDRSKLEELDHCYTLRTWQRMRGRYLRRGVAGLSDMRTGRLGTGVRIDSQVLELLLGVLGERVHDSTRTKQWVIDETARRIQCLKDPPNMPSRSTMYRAIDLHCHGLHTFGESATRRSIAKSPPTPFSVTQGWRPGERVEIDSTTADLMVIDSHGRSVRPQLTVAVDTATRSILAAHFDLTVKSVDLAALAGEMVCPERTQRHFEDSVRLRHPLADQPMRVSLTERLSAHEEHPVIMPDTFVVDLGKQYVSRHFTRVCEQLMISLEPTRGGTPTDKGTVERTIQTVNLQFCQNLPGYTGRSAAHRGRDIRAELTMQQVQDLLDEWIATTWQRQVHQGIRAAWVASGVSPNRCYSAFVAKTGSLTCPRSQPPTTPIRRKGTRPAPPHAELETKIQEVDPAPQSAQHLSCVARRARRLDPTRLASSPPV